ncbi:ABC transporter permease [Actinomyces provencensis]|uniref:ABC transporter permease n=1 Tax=Actinomyces provencensis TaxID=1720198 RepID=UPI00096A82F1|nr:ABC transporter permease [Actinomyces provencensis]
MIRVSLRGIRARLGRFLLAVLAVALGVGFVAGTFSLRAVLADTFNGIVDAAADADAYLRSSTPGSADTDTAGTRPEIPASLAEEVADVPGVATAVAEASGTLVLVGSDGTAVTTSGAPTLGVIARSDVPTFTPSAGRFPHSDDEILLEDRAARQAGLGVGDTTKIVTTEGLLEVRVVGTASFPAATAGALIVGLTQDLADRLYAPHGTVSTISVYADGGTSEEQLRENLQDWLGTHADRADTSGVEAVTGDTVREESRDSVDQILGFVQTFLLVFASVSLFVGAFLVTNTFSMSIHERMREFAMLRAVGASPTQVMVSVLAQALVIGILGSALGVGLGVGIASAIAAVLEHFGMEIGSGIALTWQTVVISFAVGIAVSLVSAAIPGRRAATAAPVEAMRPQRPTEKGLLLRGLLGGVLVVAGGAGVVWSALRRTADGSAVDHAGTILGVGAAVLVLGVLVVAPVLARWVVPVLGWPFSHFLRPLGRIAVGNVVRNPRRTASTAGALMIGMVLVAASGVLAASTRASISDLVDSDLRSDLVVQTASGAVAPQEAVTQMEQQPAVASFDEFRGGAGKVAGPGATGQGSDVVLVSAPTQFYEHSVGVTLDEGDLASFDRGEAMVLRSVAKDQGWELGDELTIRTSTAEHPLEVRIGSVVDSQIMVGTGVLLTPDVFAEVVPESSSYFISAHFTARDGDVAALRSQLTDVARQYYVFSVMDSEQMVSALSQQVDSMLAVIYALLGLSVVIAVLGIVNTLVLSIIERTREVALLRIVGLGRMQMAGVITIESVMTALFGTILGVAVGVGVASALPTVFRDQGLSTLVVPWGTLAVMVLLTVVVGLVAAVVPSVRAARLPLLEGLAAE